MTRLAALHLAGTCLLIGAILGSEIVARPSGLDAPELTEPAVGVEIGGILYRPDPASPITLGGMGVAGFGSGWDYPDGRGAAAAEAAVPLPAPALLLAGAILGCAALARTTRRTR